MKDESREHTTSGRTNLRIMNKQKVTERILDLISTAEVAIQVKYEPYFSENHDTVEQNLDRVTGAFCGSWLGYHANVFYKDFEAPAPGDGFSVEWGLKTGYGRGGTGGWIEVTDEQVHAEIWKGVDSNYETKLISTVKEASVAFEEAHSSLVSVLAVLLESGATTMLKEINKRVSNIKPYVSSQDIVTYMTPRGTRISRDMEAVSHGLKAPPHIGVKTWHMSAYSRFESLSQIIKEANKLHKYMDMHDLIEYQPDKQGARVFIGHGRSPLWRELKDFIESRLSLQFDEYNREPTAGLARKERLQTMLDQASIAFLIMTAEDLHADDTVHARENVIHEIGLFQGRLGFRKAIVLLEEGCQEFSNIVGLDQIRFPRGELSTRFEDIRLVLEREGILKT